MKKFFAVLLALCMLFSVCTLSLAEEEQTEPAASMMFLEGRDFLYDETESGFYMSVQVPAVYLAEEMEEAFPQLQKAFDGFNAELRQEAERIFGLMKESATQEFIENSGYTGLESESWVEIHRAGDANAVSVLVYSCVDLGGPHPSYTYTARTFDCTTGNVISLSEAIKDTDMLAKILADELKAGAESEDEFLCDDLETAIRERIDSGSLVWTVDYQGMTFYFPQDDLYVYAAGPKSVFIPFGINADVFADADYIGTSCIGYAVSFAPDRAFSFLLSESAPANTIYVTAVESEDDMSELNVIVDDVKTAIDWQFYMISTINLVHMEDKNYLYVGTRGDNDYSTLLVLEINPDKTVTEKGNMLCTGLYSTTGRDGYLEVLAGFDPAYFILNTTVDILSTASGYRAYETGKDGMPEPFENAYTMLTPFTLTLLQDIKNVKVIDEITEKESGKTELKAGDFVTIEVIDLEAKTIRAELTDARTVEFSYSMTDGSLPILVNGVDAEQLFDGMVYAG